MLSKEDNELLTRVGPGTPVGNLMRQYWVPAFTSDDVVADGPPIRVRLLGENLIAFRATSGKVGLLGDLCPHRCASLFFGRNEQEGLRCIYHGWKFDVTGACIDQPGEPEELRFEARVFATAYPCAERNGIIWTYMGPRRTPPPLPDLEANMQAEPSVVSRTLRYCNWLQGLEGDIDTVHSEYLHAPATINVADLAPASGAYFRHRLRKPLSLTAIETDYGTSYGAARPAEEGTTYWRIAHFLFPFYTMPPSIGVRVRIWVPVDDEHVLFWTVSRGFGTRRQPREGRANGNQRPTSPGEEERGGYEYLPDSSDWLGRFRPRQGAANDYLIDREWQWASDFSGIRGGAVMEDTAVTESMGPVLDRTKEHLGHSDTMIARTRQRLLNAVASLEQRSEAPPGVDSPQVYRTRSCWMILPEGVDWWEGSEEMRRAFVEVPDERVALAALQS